METKMQKLMGYDQTRQREADAAFDAAITQGRLSPLEDAPNYVGDFMYMGSVDGRAKFKHYNTREYLA